MCWFFLFSLWANDWAYSKMMKKTEFSIREIYDKQK